MMHQQPLRPLRRHATTRPTPKGEKIVLLLLCLGIGGAAVWIAAIYGTVRWFQG
jgi:hypothetical protein